MSAFDRRGPSAVGATSATSPGPGYAPAAPAVVGKQPLVPQVPFAQPQAQPPGASRQGDDAPQSGATDPIYVNDNRLPLIGAIMDRISATPLAQPHARLRWASEARARDALALAISTYLRATPDITLKRMMMLSYPADLFEIVDQARRGPAGTRFEAVKLAVATAFDEPLVASLTRMGPRVVVQLEAHPGERITGASVVGSCPLDGVVAELLTDLALVSHVPAKTGAPDDTGGKPFLRSLRTIRYEWQGAKDPGLWNWIKVTAPVDATVEEVADAFNDHEQAYRIAASPPYFGIPFEIARDVEEARAHAPGPLRAKLATGPGPRVAAAEPLAISTVADEAAKAQAPPASPASQDEPVATHALERVHVQLAFMTRQLAPWHASDPLAGAIAFAERRRAEFGRDARTAPSWTSVLAAQERALFAAASELTELLEDVTRTGVQPADAPSLPPVMRALQAYARTGGVSHLHAEAPSALAEARRLRALLPLALAEDQIRTARGEVVGQRQAEAQAGASEPRAEATPSDVHDQLRRAADLRLQAAHGDKLDPDAIEQLSLDASETALRARLITLATQAHAVMRKADDIGLSQRPYPSGAWSVHMVAAEILRKVNGPTGQRPADDNDRTGGGWHAELDLARRYAGPRDGLSANQAIGAQRRDAIRRVGSHLDRFAHELDLGDYMKFAYAQIADEQLRGLLRTMALQIGIAIVTGEVIGAVGAAARGAALAGQIGAELRQASLLAQGAEALATATANTATQGTLGGEANARALAENALAVVLTSAVLQPFQGLLRDSAAIESEIQTWAKTAGALGRAAAELAIDSGASLGAAGVAHAITHGGQLTQASAEDWVTIGLSIAAAKFVHQRTQGMHRRILEASRDLRTSPLDRLRDQVAALEQRSDLRGARRPTPEQAIELLSERHRLLLEEQRLYSANPKASQALAGTTADLAATGPQFAAVPLQLAHLSPIVEGHAYEGTAAQIERAFQAADATGVRLEREWLPDQTTWRVTTGDRVIEIHERGGNARREVESRGAHEVPNSSFRGKPAPGETRRKVELREVEDHARSAATILQGPEPTRFSYPSNGLLMVSVGPEWCAVRFSVVDSMANVAKHTYKHGDTKAWIEVSELARPEDLTRAIAHELEEIVALMESRSRNVIDPAALVKGSHATELSHHDRGRKAELKVLLYELEHQPGRRADILKEITALVDHLGFSPTTITSDARAAKLLGGDTVVRLDKALAGKRRFWVKEAELRADERLTTKEWKFWLEAPSPDGRPHDLVTASVMLDDSGRPMSGPSFYLDNRVQIQHGELRITVGEPGTPTSITDLAIQRANTAFKNRFGHDPTELPGSLAYDNKEIFIREYISRIDKGVDAKTAAIQAAKATPFVQARDRAGYRDVEVKPFTSMKKVVYGDPPRIREVPDTIEVIARKK